MFLLTASAHWGRGRADLIRMVPEALGRAAFWVSLTGFAEIAIAIGLQIPTLAPWTAAAAVVSHAYAKASSASDSPPEPANGVPCSAGCCCLA
jgi:uncharacterized membrane protein